MVLQKTISSLEEVKQMPHHHTPNDDRSNSKNPNNPAYHAAIVNRDDQLNPNNAEFKGNNKITECKVNTGKGENEKDKTEK